MAATYYSTRTGVLSLGTVGSSANDYGASLTGQVLTLQPASQTKPGIVTAGAQTFGGAKTFASTISASNLSGTNTGDITLAAIGSSANANGASLSNQVLTLQPASASFGGVVTTGTQTFAGAKTFSGEVTINSAAYSWVLGQVIAPQTNVMPSAVVTSGWNAIGHGGSPDPGAATVTDATTDVTDPVGGSRAIKIVLPATSGTGWVLAGHGASVSGKYECSVWLRTASGTATVWLETTPDGVTIRSVQCNVTTTWTRFILPADTSLSGTNYWQLGVDLRDGTQTGQGAQTIYAWGAWYNLKA